MRSLRWSSTSLCTKFSALPRHRACLLQCRFYQIETPQLDHKGRVIRYEPPTTYHGTDGRVTFDRVGVHKSVVEALREAFPSVQYATATQQQFIKAVLDGKDVFLQDHTGTGKSFGLVLALLSKRRKSVLSTQKNGQGAPAISSLVIVPHRDLAYQFLNWVERIHSHTPGAGPLESVAQAVVRHAAKPLAEQISSLRANPPQIVVGTPQALSDVLQKDKSALMLDTVTTVVVDEADYLIESMPRTGDKYAKMKAARQMRAHPSPTRQILDIIYGSRTVPLEHANQKTRSSHEPEPPRTSSDSPQIIMSTATFRVDLKHTLLRSGWFTRGRDGLVRISGASIPPNLNKPSLENEASQSLGGTFIQHHALIVSAEGRISNIENAVDALNVNRSISDVNIMAGEGDARSQLDDANPSEPIIDVDDGNITKLRLPFRTSMLEAIGEAFALDVPRLALLVLPASAPVQQVVFELQAIGVNADALDVYQAETGGAHLRHEEAGGHAVDEPTLLVSTFASVRGLDLPDLTHVFILGVPEDRPVDTYLHASGRVGRFGRSGKVISILEARHVITTKKGKPGLKDEPQKLQRMFKQMGIRPTKLAHFG